MTSRSSPISSSPPRSRAPSRAGSEITDRPEYPKTLEHILTRPISTEISLRTMYTLNTSPHVQPVPKNQWHPQHLSEITKAATTASSPSLLHQQDETLTSSDYQMALEAA